jgi:hypothetical protein
MPNTIDIVQLAPVTDAQAVRLASPAAFADLASQITATPVPAPEAARHRRRSARRAWSPAARPAGRPVRRALLLGAPLAALAAVAGLLVTVLTPGGNGPGGQAAIEALSFIKDNGHTTVIIRNLYADTSWYNADLARHHIGITLHLSPVSPSLVGYIDVQSASGSTAFSDIKPVAVPGSCGLPGTDCQIGFTVPDNFRGQVDMWIGRPARPGEQYVIAGSAFNRGEPLYGLENQIFGHPLSEVLPVLAQRQVTVAQCREEGVDNPPNGGICDPAGMPANWYVRGVTPWAPNQVLLVIGPLPYPASGSFFTPGEPLAGLQSKIIGHQVGEVLPLFARHHVTVAQCFAERAASQPATRCDPSAMPATWYVRDVSPYGGNQVIVVIGQEKPAPGTGR